MSDAAAPTTTPATTTTPAAPPGGAPAAAPAAPSGGRAAALEKARAVLAERRAAAAPAHAPASGETPAGEAAADAPGDGTAADPAEQAREPGPLDKRIRALKAERKRAREATQRAERMIAEAEARARTVEERTKSWEQQQAEDRSLRERDPYTWAIKNGLNFREIAKRAVSEKKPEPPDISEHPAVAELKAKIAEFEKRTSQLQEQTQAAFTRTHMAGAFAETDAEAYPFLHRALDRTAVIEESIRVVDAYRQMHGGQAPQARKVFDALERQYREQYKRLSRAAGASAPAGSPAPIPAQAGAAPAAQPAGSPKPKVTQRTAGERVSAQTPLSPEERRSRAIARFKAAAASRH